MKKHVLMLVALLVALAMMAGCSGSGSGASSAQESVASDGAAEPAAAGSDEAVTITYMQWQQEFSTAAITLADAYMAEFPNVTVEVVTNSDGYSENLKAALVAGNVPEIFVTEGYENMKSYGDYLTDLSGEEWVGNIKEAALQCVTLDGKVMGMPITMAGEGIVYNKAMFEEHGWQVPTTLSELEELCKTIQAADITPFNNQFADDWLLGQFASGAGFAYVPDNAAYLQELYAGNATLAGNEQMLNSFKVLDLMLEYGQPDSMSYSWNETCTAFATGEAAMAFEGDWIWDTIVAIEPDIQCGIFAVPATEDPADSKMIADANGCFHIGKGSQNPEAGLAYLEWIATSETAKAIMLQDYKVIPVFEGWDYQADNQLAESTMEYLDAGMSYLWSWPQWPAGFQYSTGKTYQKYINGDVDAEGALQEMDAEWTRLVNP